MRKPLPIKALFDSDYIDQQVYVAGWLRSARRGKRFSFAVLNDGSCFQSLQIVIDNSRFPAHVLDNLHTGGCIAVEGTVVRSPGREQAIELQAQNITIFGTADPATYPLQKKQHSLEFLRTIAHLRPRTRFFSAVLRIRNTLSYAIHQFFQERGFFYIHTPIITASDCEGAGELFQVTTFDLNDVPKQDGMVDYQQDFFGKPAYLTVSGQLNVETTALALTKVYTFGPTFRAEHSNTPRHLAEFWMVEPEMAFYDLEDTMDLAEEFLKNIIQKVLDNHQDDLAFLSQFNQVDLTERLKRVIQEPYERLPYTEAIAILEASKKNFQFPVKWGIDLKTEHERYLTEEYFKKPVIVYNYPAEVKAFYMRQNDDGKTVAAMDVLFPEVGEIIGGSQREERYERLLQRIQTLGLKIEDYHWYLAIRQYGSAPHSGFGLGLERLVQFCTGMANIRDTIPFPRAYGLLNF